MAKGNSQSLPADLPGGPSRRGKGPALCHSHSRGLWALNSTRAMLCTHTCVSVLDSDVAVLVLLSQMVQDLDAGMLVAVRIRSGTARGHYREGTAAVISLR